MPVQKRQEQSLCEDEGWGRDEEVDEAGVVQIRSSSPNPHYINIPIWSNKV